MGRDGMTDERTKAALRRRVFRLEAAAGVHRHRADSWPIPQTTIDAAVEVLRQCVAPEMLRQAIEGSIAIEERIEASRRESGEGPAA